MNIENYEYNENFYSSVRLTAAEFIEADDAQFSDFKYILQKGNYLGMLKTYGHYTVQPMKLSSCI
ncbi:hypothetical protein [uncultured Prevotella sp.]|uniref:hypothetical protein n=1 Tax=uncultured Prevotella sp. TaxID=159272 RepID=UPI002584C709|nr:hypothetical protein [uncultured Prevotella sp.]